ncbi:hypothetical protein K1719_033579 [Acacia pycnantha]|nr:hypothetical protein K1719_033579 [Acacia pycnantha]
MAMVVYGRRMLGDITNKIEVLGLKRNAVEEWESSEAKRIKSEKVVPDPKPEISMYADNLRKAKAKVRRATKRKGRGATMDRLEEGMEVENEIESIAVGATTNSGFIFTAGSRRKTESIAEGAGGWPLTATKLS